MTRLLILILALNALLPSMGFSAMLSSGADQTMTMSQTVPHNMIMPSSSIMTDCADSMESKECADKMQNMLCEIKCAIACVQVPILFSLPSLSLLSPYSSEPIIAFAYFYTRSISPELHPPLV